MRRAFGAATLIVLAIALPGLCLAEAARSVTITILHDNSIHRGDLQAEWGFSCLIAGARKTILFDVGGRPCALRTNLQAAGIDLSTIDAIAFSHAHADHIGGFECLLPLPPTVSVFVPSWFPIESKREIEAHAANTIRVDRPTEICADALLTGPIAGLVVEEALCVRTSSGVVVITGCAHPGIARIVERAQSLFPDEIVSLVLGGFHLLQEDEATLRAVARRLLELGVKRVAPTHCSGDLARAVFRDLFGTNYIEAGVGLVLEL